MVRTALLLLGLVMVFNGCAENSEDGEDHPSSPSSVRNNFTEGKDYVVLQRVRFLDRMGFDRPVEAFSLLFPKGWRTDGGVKWRGVNECRGDMISNYVKASSPDGAFQFEGYPSRSFSWSDDRMMMQSFVAGAGAGGCEVNQPFSAAEYLEGFARMTLGATASDIRLDEPSMAKLRPIDEQANAIARQYGNNTEQGSTIVFGKLQWPDGTAGIAHVGVTNSITHKPNYMGGGVTSWSSTHVFHFVVLRCPKDRIEEGSKLLAMIMASSRTNPAWQQAKDQFMMNLGNIEHAGRMEKIRLMGEQSAAYARAQSDASDRQMRSWENQQASQDKQHTRFVQTIREVETWKDASGSPVEMSAGYDQAWSRGDGSYILSNKPGFDPSSVFQDQSWTEMKRAE